MRPSIVGVESPQKAQHSIMKVIGLNLRFVQPGTSISPSSSRKCWFMHVLDVAERDTTLPACLLDRLLPESYQMRVCDPRIL